MDEISLGPGQYGSGAAAIAYDPALPRYVRITDIGPQGGLNAGTLASIHWGEAKPHMLNEGDLCFARSGATVGKTYLYDNVDGPCAHAGYVIRFAIDESVALPQYVKYWTQSEGYWRWVNNTFRQGAQPNINALEYGRHQLPLPPLAEQRRIAEILDAIDSQISAIGLDLVKQRSLRIAALRYAMGDGLELIASVETSRFREIEGISRGEWSAVRLGTLLSRIEAGHSPDLEDRPAGHGEWGVLKVSAVGRDGFRSAENKVAPDGKMHHEALCVRVGDLIMTRANTADLVGLSCVIEDTPSNLMLCDKTLRLIVDKKKASVAFVNLVLEMHELRTQIQIAATGTSASMKNIGQSSIRNLVVPFSDLVNLGRVCGLDVAYRESFEKQQAELRNLRALKQGLMEDLLSGRVRV
ncbi:restriction endonuclease subunit S [Actinomadura barringtoniae]|uniref:Restriction endonuclease subunit S n=1 Tax=Actinomadura barringtoniae TaxID=1427535 RepID=A0A939P7D4_9ACTN|nr:restriction endonuclease subunit S [Actinomadura barringtoniae]MBO2447102.1 restriction endonuclease subunit S [Actinomadura barringtoniae]